MIDFKMKPMDVTKHEIFTFVWCSERSASFCSRNQRV